MAGHLSLSKSLASVLRCFPSWESEQVTVVFLLLLFTCVFQAYLTNEETEAQLRGVS